MSGRLSMRLALRRADGTLDALPRFTQADDPLRVRAHLLAFYEIRDSLQRARAGLVGRPGALRERLQLGVLLDEVRDAIEAARDCLRRIARHGGRGTPPGAGRSPAVEGHGCPALSPAVGPAPRPCPAGEAVRDSGNRGLHNLPADPLFRGRTVQELPGRSDPATVTQHGENAPC